MLKYQLSRNARASCRAVFMFWSCQVLRYNESQAYVVHYDYLESAEGHDFKSEGLGTNRFATVSPIPMGRLECELRCILSSPMWRRRQEIRLCVGRKKALNRGKQLGS